MSSVKKIKKETQKANNFLFYLFDFVALADTAAVGVASLICQGGKDMGSSLRRRHCTNSGATIVLLLGKGTPDAGVRKIER